MDDDFVRGVLRVVAYRNGNGTGGLPRARRRVDRLPKRAGAMGDGLHEVNVA